MKYQPRICWCGLSIDNLHPNRITCCTEHYRILEQMYSGETLDEYQFRKDLQNKELSTLLLDK